MKQARKYLRLWFLFTIRSFQVNLITRFSAFLFFVGKVLRFILFIVFLISLFKQTDRLLGYSVYEMMLFFLTFNLIDTLTQLLFREVYRFRQLIVTGDFDLVLIKPMSALFRSLVGGADPMDLFMLFPYTVTFLYISTKIPAPEILDIVYFFLLFINGMIIAAAFHILVLSLAVLTTEIDHTIMIYRDITTMVRVPVDIYIQPIRSILLFVIPVGIMISYPAQALLGLLSFSGVVISAVVGMVFVTFSLFFWRHALSQYASASS